MHFRQGPFLEDLVIAGQLPGYIDKVESNKVVFIADADFAVGGLSMGLTFMY